MISTTRTSPRTTARRTMSEALDWTDDEAVEIDEPIDTEDSDLSLDGDEPIDTESTHDRISFVVRMHGKLLPLAQLKVKMAEAYIRELKLEQRELLQRLDEVETEMHKLGLDPQKTNPTPRTKNPKEETMKIKHTVQGPVPATPRTPVRTPAMAKATPKTPVKTLVKAKATVKATPKTQIATPARTPARTASKATAKAKVSQSTALNDWHTLTQEEIADNIEVIGELLYLDADSPSGYGRRDGKPFTTRAGSTYRTLLKDVHGFVKSNSLDAHLKANRADRSLFKATAKATKRRNTRD